MTGVTYPEGGGWADLERWGVPFPYGWCMSCGQLVAFGEGHKWRCSQVILWGFYNWSRALGWCPLL